MSGLIPRLSFEELRPDLAEMLRPRVERLGCLGEFFKCDGGQPQALMYFMQFTVEADSIASNRLFRLQELMTQMLEPEKLRSSQNSERC
jgi:hypothetical protein